MSAAIINVLATKTHFSQLLAKVAAGEEVIIGKHGKPVARLIPYRPKVPPRKLGTLRKHSWEAPGAWTDDPEILDPSYLSHLIKDHSPTLTAARKAR